MGGIDDETMRGTGTKIDTRMSDTDTGTAIDRRREESTIMEGIAIKETTGTTNRRRANITAGVRRRDIATTRRTVEEAGEIGTMGTAIASARVRPLVNDDGRRRRRLARRRRRPARRRTRGPRRSIGIARTAVRLISLGERRVFNVFLKTTRGNCAERRVATPRRARRKVKPRESSFSRTSRSMRRRKRLRLRSAPSWISHRFARFRFPRKRQPDDAKVSPLSIVRRLKTPRSSRTRSTARRCATTGLTERFR